VSVDPAATPQPGTTVFETHIRVRFHEVDALGHVNNAAYLNYLEQAAIDHAFVLGLDMERMHELGGVFVARRHDITFLRPATAGELLRIVTWLAEARGARVERHYRVWREPDASRPVALPGRIVIVGQTLNDAELVVSATTEWVFVGHRGQPRRIPAAVAALFRGAASNADSSPDGD
jgi:YbgC/YbaW family acyl-CoA thioester hydrolase